MILPADPILRYPSPKLRQRAEEVVRFDHNLERLAGQMLMTTKTKNGLGLSGNQIGVLQRIFVTRFDGYTQAWINPEIVAQADTKLGEEGCLSFPSVIAKVPRSHWLNIRYDDPAGHEHTDEVTGLLAVCCQHEIDHLNGKLFIDYLSPLQRERLLRKMNKLDKQDHSSANQMIPLQAW